MLRTPIIVLLALAALALPATLATAQQPAVNLGFTSFLDGGPPSGPGFYFQEYLQYYYADKLHDNAGDKVPIPDFNVNVFVSLNQFIYQSDQDIFFGGKWGIDGIVPVVATNATGVPDSNTGLGDILIGPFLQWDPIMGENGPIFMHRVELQNILPLGEFDDHAVVNPGSGFYSFDPYWAGTYFITPRWTASARLHYLWNNTTEHANVIQFPDVHDEQAGMAFHMNFATEYEIIPNRFRAGINGYYLKQFTDTKVNGDSVSGSQEQVVGIGPGALLHLGKNDHIFFNFYVETLAENRTEGYRTVLRWVHHF